MHAHNTPHTLVKFKTMAEVSDISLSKDVFEKAVKNALGRVNTSGICNLSQHQSKALFNFLCGKDSFVCLPTGHGKSLIYQLCPIVVKELSSIGLKQFQSDPLVVVVSPLNSLIEDQIGSCGKMGLKACKVDSESLEKLKDSCDFEILYASPEIFDDQEARSLRQQYSARLVGIVIDESHCIVHW